MKTKLHLYLFMTFMFAINVINPTFIAAQKVQFPAIVPAPVSLVQAKGHFKLSEKTKIVVDTDSKDARDVAIYFTEQLKALTGMQLSVSQSMEKSDNSFILKLNFNSSKKEAYSLSITEKEIVLNGSGPAGLFYGVQTFFQLIDPKISHKSKISVPCVEIKDEPLYAWRGMHLDVCRHFFPIDFVKKMIDRMAELKLNTFHWHLTDDQGWRIEIKKYPKLTDISAWRDETMVGHYTETDQKFDGIRYGGYYTQAQIKEVVAYAKNRFITIVPEIEMPGHAVAVLAAYPEYSCTGGPFKVYTKWGVSDDVFCAGKEGTFELLENILNEVADLFPGPYIHIGGDECPKTRWKACADCQKRINDNGLRDELELQSYFVKRIENFIASKGKKLIGWDEILEGGLPERATVMSWRGYKGGIEAAHSGHDVVMTPTDYCYFDYYQGSEKDEPLAIGGFLPLEKVYSFNPLPPQLSIDQKKHILGAQANVWTEYITTEKHLEYMVFPRLCAMAEILWTPRELQNYPNFFSRLPVYLQRLNKAGVNYRPISK
jgi:hexosaminidase